MGKRLVAWDEMDILFQDDEPSPEGSEITLPDYDYDGGFTDEEVINDLQSNYISEQR